MKYQGKLPPEGINVSKTHPLKEFFILSGGILGAVLLVFLVLGWIAGWLATRLPDSYEEKLGQVFSRTHKPAGQGTDLANAEVYVGKLLAQLTRDVPKKSFPYAVLIECAKQVNAFALPGGKIVLLSGLLEKLKNEEALVLLLGHELGHHLHRDHLRALGRSLALSAAMLSLGFSEDSRLLRKIANAGGDLLMLRFSREQEMAADDLGWQLLQQHYPSAGSGLALFQILGEEGPEWREKIPSIALTHPHASDRLKRLQARLQVEQKNLQVKFTPLPEGIFSKICDDE